MSLSPAAALRSLRRRLKDDKSVRFDIKPGHRLTAADQRLCFGLGLGDDRFRLMLGALDHRSRILVGGLRLGLIFGAQRLGLSPKPLGLGQLLANLVDILVKRSGDRLVDLGPAKHDREHGDHRQRDPARGVEKQGRGLGVRGLARVFRDGRRDHGQTKHRPAPPSRPWLHRPC